MGFCRNMKDFHPIRIMICPISEDDNKAMCFSRIEKGIYFRVDSDNKGDSLKSGNEGCVKVLVIQYIIFFFFLKEYIDK